MSTTAGLRADFHSKWTKIDLHLSCAFFLLGTSVLSNQSDQKMHPWGESYGGVVPQDSVTPQVSPPLPANIVFLSSPLSFFLSCAKQGALINQVLQEKSPQVSRGRSA